MVRGRRAIGRPATKRRVLRIAPAAFALAMLAPAPALAQCICSGPSGGGYGYPAPSSSSNNAQSSALLATLDIGSIFLQKLGRNSAYSGNAAANSNPGGGGAPADSPPRYRSWTEIYGVASDTDAQGTFVGDRRETFGTIAGLGATVAPGFNVGVSVDHGRTRIDVPAALQKATLRMTQIGAYAAYETGPWTFALAGIHGFAHIDSSRILDLGGIFFGPHAASYGGGITGGLAEASYYRGLGQWRIVPKVAVEYTYSKTDAFTEFNGPLPMTVGQATGERARVLIGGEVGHYWIFGQHVLDVSAYAKFIDNFHQRIGSVAVSSLGGAITAAGVKESTTGIDAGGMLSFGLTGTARAYLAYDGKFRDGFTSHHGTAGLEFRF